MTAAGGLRLDGFIDLPAHAGAGGFDHAAVHAATGRCYVAHTANDALDVIDLPTRAYVGSIGGLRAVAGALVDEASGQVFTSNRGDNTVGVLAPPKEHVEKIAVGIRPNGLAWDPGRGRLLCAHVGDPAVPGSFTVALVDVAGRRRLADVPVPGRTRWTVFDPAAGAFHVNVMDPPAIVVVSAGDPIAIRRVVQIGHAGPHGLDLDAARRRLYCACDAGVLVALDADTGDVVGEAPLAGAPDVVFLDPVRRRLYVAVGDPGVLEVFDTGGVAPCRLGAIVTEAGAHTLAFEPRRGRVCAFLPRTHRAAVFVPETG
jgi:DNA-binding beta-propeller fold protein YncE